MPAPITVLIVDDSATMRMLLSQLLSTHADIRVLGTAEDPFDAREKIKQLNPDVLTLDVEMPKMDGLSFLEKIMALRPMPVIMVSTLTGRGTETAIAALQRGAVDCIAKPTLNPMADNAIELAQFSEDLAAKIRIARFARLQPRKPPATPSPLATRSQATLARHAPKLIAIGASTGGVEALTEVLTSLPPHLPPIAITQHMPAGFTESFARRLSGLCSLQVCQATHKATLKHGHAYIAPGGMQFSLHRVGQQFVAHIEDAPPVNNHKPSVDVLFESVAREAAGEALGIILTGMGRDGAKGLLAIRHAGAHTIGQDESSCVVYGMPRAAAEMGAVIQTLPLSSIAETINARCLA